MNEQQQQVAEIQEAIRMAEYRTSDIAQAIARDAAEVAQAAWEAYIAEMVEAEAAAEWAQAQAEAEAEAQRQARRQRITDIARTIAIIAITAAITIAIAYIAR